MGSSPILSIIENIEPGVVILNNDLSVSHINRMFLLMFSHFKRERLFEGNVLDFHDEEIRRKITEMLRLTRESKRQIPLSLKILRHDGLDCYLLIKLVPLMEKDMAHPVPRTPSKRYYLENQQYGYRGIPERRHTPLRLPLPAVSGPYPGDQENHLLTAT